MPTESASIQPVPQRVFVAIYEHPHGTDVRVFTDGDRAMHWRTGLAKEWWSNAFDDDPPPDDVIGEEYFERMLERDEFFSMQECDVESGPRASAETPPGDL
ncbi:MAG: hypothetical protein WA975_19080 [Mesorhizobium sp.]